MHATPKTNELPTGNQRIWRTSNSVCNPSNDQTIDRLWRLGLADQINDFGDPQHR